MNIKPVSIMDLVFTSQNEHKKIALDGGLALKDKLLVSNLYGFNSSLNGRQLQR